MWFYWKELSNGQNISVNVISILEISHIKNAVRLKQNERIILLACSLKLLFMIYHVTFVMSELMFLKNDEHLFN